eukprot:53222_1
MAHIIENSTLTEQYESLLEYIPNHFHVIGQSKLPEIIIPEINNKQIHYPLSTTTIDQIKQISQTSSFGRGTETVKDPNIRLCSELTPKQFSFSFADDTNHTTKSVISSQDNPHLELIRKSLAPHIEYIICKPYKLLLYEKHSFFKAHVDTPLTANHFGTLIVSLPTQNTYEGGDFLLTFNDEQIKWNPNSSHGNQSEFIAFYSDVQHEIKPVISGHRVVITFNILIPDEIKDNDFEEAMIDNTNNAQTWGFVSNKLYIKPTESDELNRYYSPFVQQMFNVLMSCAYCKDIPQTILWIILDFNGDHPVIGAIENLLNDDQYHSSARGRNANPGENGVCLIFGHRYHGEFVNPLTLKGQDMYVYRTLKQYFGTFLTAMTVNAVIGKWSDEYEDEDEAERVDYQGRTIDEWNEGDERTEWLINLGKNGIHCKIPLILRSKIWENNSIQSSFVVLYSNQEQTLTDAKYLNKGEEWYGNVGAYDIENQYHCTGLLLTKCERPINKFVLGKRKQKDALDEDEQPKKKRKIADGRTVCRYDKKCYRKNRDHLKRFRHPQRELKEANEVREKANADIAQIVKMREQMEKAAQIMKEKQLKKNKEECEKKEKEIEAKYKKIMDKALNEYEDKVVPIKQMEQFELEKIEKKFHPDD